MKKLALTLSTLIIFSAINTYAEPFPIIPIGCPIEQTNCVKPCEKPEGIKCNTPQVFESCEEAEKWRIKYFEKRCNIYTKLGLTQEQRIKAKCIDEKYFDLIAPLKMSLKQEDSKLCDMKCKKACKNEIKCQKDKIKDLKDELNDKKKQHEKCFEEILNSCQKTTYNKLKKETCHKYKSPKCNCNCK